MYATNSKKYIRYFYAKKQNILAYSRGIEQRGKNLGKVYMLDKISLNREILLLIVVGDLEIFLMK